MSLNDELEKTHQAIAIISREGLNAGTAEVEAAVEYLEDLAQRAQGHQPRHAKPVATESAATAGAQSHKPGRHTLGPPG